MSLKGKRIILGVTGSVAAIKAPAIARELVQAGAIVNCAVTENALEFVSVEELRGVSGEDVVTKIFSFDQNHPLSPSFERRGDFDRQNIAKPRGDAVWHVHLARSADAMIVAPCSASTIGKLRGAIYDNPVTLLAASLPRTTPLFVAPAMDEEMWLQPALQDALEWLKKHGVRSIGPVSGPLASGLTGFGRMTEPSDIVKALELALPETTASDTSALSTTSFGRAGSTGLRGKRILITGGPTYEPIDAVRFIGNRSSGKMAAAIALEAKRMGAEVTLVMGPSPIGTDGLAKRLDVETAEEMLNAVKSEVATADIIIMSAAVADFAPEQASDEKLKKGSSESMTLTLKRTPDILSEVARTKRSDQILVGFALEKGTSAEDYAKSKLKKKNLDMIVLNNIADEGAGFGYDTNKITIFTRSGEREALPLMTKEECAQAILSRIAAFCSRNL